MEEYSYIQNTESDYATENLLEIEDIPREEVLEMIKSLPPGYRTVFNLFIFEDMSHREIAKELGISEAASRSQFYRAKSLLKKKITAILSKNKQRQL